MSFCKQMRKATRDVHAISDALVNAKLMFALSDNKVWAEGLLVFYEIFRFLESTTKETNDFNVKKLLQPDFFRTEALEFDLSHYLGENWKNKYEIRHEVSKYLLHLQHLREENTYLLMSYIYHLYMGLLSGGQILTKKRLIKNKLLFKSEGNVTGYAITNFGENSIASLKSTMRSTMDEIAEELTEEQKKNLIVESRLVFEWNNTIIKSVKGTDGIIIKKVIFFLGALLLLFIIYYLFI